MTLKKLTFCILCFANIANLATEEDFNNENSSNSGVEENSLINKNNWNTRKWGDIYFLFPQFSVPNVWFKLGEQYSILGKLENKWGIMFNWLFSGGLEYKYMFHKKWGINIRLNLNNLERIGFLTKTFSIYEKKGMSKRQYPLICTMYSKIKLDHNEKLKEKDPISINIETGYTCFSLEFSFEKIWGKKIVHTNEGIIEMIYSSSFSPIGFAFHVISFDAIKDIKFTEKVIFTGTIILLKIEFSKVSFLNFGKIKFNWHTLPYLCKFGNLKNFFIDLLFNFFSLEFGINIINNKNDQKKSNDEIEN